uniref:Uncharacterized protein n=1 Tax=Arundo donax TaxID=35708 RepID=A0A0A9F9N3_ARUDO
MIYMDSGITDRLIFIQMIPLRDLLTCYRQLPRISIEHERVSSSYVSVVLLIYLPLQYTHKTNRRTDTSYAYIPLVQHYQNLRFRGFRACKIISK